MNCAQGTALRAEGEVGRWKRYCGLSVRRKRAKKEDNGRENCWSKGVFAYLEGRRFLSSKKGEIIIGASAVFLSFLASRQRIIKYEYLLIPIFSLPSFFLLLHYYTRYYAIITLFKKHLSNFTNRSISKKLNANRIPPVQKVYQWKNWKFPFQTRTESNTTNSSYSTISTSPPILSRNMACCVRSANWIVGGTDERAVSMFAARSFRLFACPCLQRAGPISRGACRDERYFFKIRFYGRVKLCKES